MRAFRKPDLLATTNPSISQRTVIRTVGGKDPKFSDEPPSVLKLNNLATHVKECKGLMTPDPSATSGAPTLVDKTKFKGSADLMAEFLRNGELNPQIVPTKRGFLRIFSAWVVEESLPWTTGEAPMLQTLFKYLKIQYPLPSDTTVRQQLRIIFLELRAKLVCEFSVCFQDLDYLHHSLMTFCFKLSFRLFSHAYHMQRTLGQPAKWCTPSHALLDVSSTTTGTLSSVLLTSSHFNFASMRESGQL